MRVVLSVIIAVTLSVAVSSSALAEEAERPRVNPTLSARDDHFLSRQAAVFFDQVRAALASNPPSTDPGVERRMAFSLLDAVAHEPYAPNRPEMIAFHHERIEQAVAEIESTQVSEGARIWQLYNDGYVVRTRSVTLGFDLFRGPSRSVAQDLGGEEARFPTPEFPISDDLARRLADQCDVLFISHWHQDHADPFIAEVMMDQGKPVVATTETFAEGKRYSVSGDHLASIHKRLRFMDRKTHVVQELPIQQGTAQLKVIVNPGHQGGHLCNNVIVTTPDGLTFAHNGDQYNDPTNPDHRDFEWIDEVKKHAEIDVLMSNCWMDDPLRYVEGTGPKLTILGHMIEMGHEAWDRMPYWGDGEFIQSSYDALLASDHPVLIMAWGESYHFTRNGK